MSYKPKKKKTAQPISLKSIVITEHVFDLDDELDMLLEAHLQNKKSKEFAQQRFSIISLSSNGSRNSNNNSMNYSNTSSLINRNILSVPSSPKLDQLTDLKTRLLTLQKVLQYLPDDIRTLRKQNLNDIDLLQPIYSNFLVVVGSNIQTEQRYFCELVDNILYLRREPHSKVKQAITISFIQSNALNTDYLTNPKNKPKNRGSKCTGPSRKYSGLFLAHLESHSANHSFKIFSPSGIYVLSAPTERDKMEWSKKIQTQLLQLFDEDTWFAKISSAEQLLPIEKEQFEIQIDRHQQIMNALTLTGLAHNVGLLGSVNKQKSGVMRILKNTHAHSYKHQSRKHHKWEDHFFVLAHCMLYYFQHEPDAKITQSSMPKSFIPLKYATVTLDVDRIRDDRFVFLIATPLRTIYLRCRHPVALAEWVSALQKSMKKCQKHAIDVQSSETILEQIRTCRSKVSTLESLLREKQGLKTFQRYLKHNRSEPLLRCWMAILHFKHSIQRANDELNEDSDDDDSDEDADDEQNVNADDENKYEEKELDHYEFENDPNLFRRLQKQAQTIFTHYIDIGGQQTLWKVSILIQFLDKEKQQELIDNCKECLFNKNVEIEDENGIIDQFEEKDAFTPIHALNNYKEISQLQARNLITILQLYDSILDILDQALHYIFSEQFMKTAAFVKLRVKFDTQDKYIPLPLERIINDFEPGTVLIFVVEGIGQRRREIKLSKKSKIATIGRDCSNTIVLDDAHVSRSHARITYDSRCAYFTDLGSHHGSYLNNTRVLRERLKPDDRLKIGGCDVTFEVRMKNNLMSKMFNKMFNNNARHRDTRGSVAFM